MITTPKPLNPYIFNRPLDENDKTCIIPKFEMEKAIYNIATSPHTIGIDVYGPKRRGKTTFANILVKELNKIPKIKTAFLSLSAQNINNIKDLISILKANTSYRNRILNRLKLYLKYKSTIDDATYRLAELAIGATNGGKFRYAVVLDGTEALPEAVWTELLHAVRNLEVLSLLKRNKSYRGRRRKKSYLR